MQCLMVEPTFLSLRKLCSLALPSTPTLKASCATHDAGLHAPYVIRAASVTCVAPQGSRQRRLVAALGRFANSHSLVSQGWINIGRMHSSDGMRRYSWPQASRGLRAVPQTLKASGTYGDRAEAWCTAEQEAPPLEDRNSAAAAHAGAAGVLSLDPVSTTQPRLWCNASQQAEQTA